jgi:hypothetical protein
MFGQQSQCSDGVVDFSIDGMDTGPFAELLPARP